jgi:ComF family protein
MIDIRLFFNQLLPQTDCLLCGSQAAQSQICAPCKAEMPWLSPAHCPVCALPTPLGEVCGQCMQRQPAFDRTVAALTYTYPADVMLRRYKYNGALPIARLLGDLLCEAGHHPLDGPLPELIIPMPLHPLRLRERGFNQAVEIARTVSRQLHVPISLDTCSRARNTPPQAGLSLADRTKNLKGAFSVDREVTGKHIALLDDVMTTGASLNALASTLKKAGALRVECWVVARTPKS